MLWLSHFSIKQFIERKFFEYFYLLAALIFIAKGRWVTSVLNPLVLNPDEAQAAANVLRMFRYGISWNGVDGGTNGPLNFLAVSWPYLFGYDITFQTLHLTALILLSLIFVFTYLIIRFSSNCFFAILFTAPLAVFYGLTKSYDFLHYSSELLPVTLLVISCYIFLHIFDKRNNKNFIQIFLIGLLLGAVPFAKLQATPIACVTGIFTFVTLFFEKSKSKIILYVVSCSIFCLIFLVPLVFHGNFGDFYYSYIVASKVYLSQPLSLGYLSQPLSFLHLHGMINVDELLLKITYFSITCGVMTLLMSSFIAPMDKRYFIKLFYFLSLLATAAYSIALPGRPFLHYFQLFPPFLLILASYLVSSFYEKFAYKISYSLACLGVLLLFVNSKDYSSIEDVIASKWNKNGFVFNAHQPNLLQFLFPKPNDTLLIWGWMPQWYIWYNMPPAIRTAATGREIENGGGELQTYYRQRLLNDLNQSQPNFIIDAVAGNSFTYNESNKNTAGIHVFPELAEIVDKNFIQLGTSQHRIDACPKIYVTKEKAESLSKKLIEFNSISASAELANLYSFRNVDSYSVTEDTCVDYWLLPDNQLGYLDINFKQAEFVKKILILNTSNAHAMDRATREIRILLKDNQKISTFMKVKMKPYPQWTTVELQSPIYADSMQIEILSFKGKGAGLNEVKLIRSESNV